MAPSLSITAATAEPALLDLPWHLPLEVWPKETIAALPKGLSRHTVRFAHLGEHVIAIKETLLDLAKREYEMLRKLEKLDVPCVEPFAIISNRKDSAGNDLPAVLITRHLKFSLPYRAMWSQGLREQTAKRLVDALSLLLVRLHLAGFFWGDVSLSNTLFRRDAGRFAAYLVDAETGQLYEGRLSNGQRENDLEIARVNIAGELMDLIASGKGIDIDPALVSQRIVDKYRELWKELTAVEVIDASERWRIDNVRNGAYEASGPIVPYGPALGGAHCASETSTCRTRAAWASSRARSPAFRPERSSVKLARTRSSTDCFRRCARRSASAAAAPEATPPR